MKKDLTRGGVAQSCILDMCASQGIGAIVGEVNQLRADELLQNLIKQDINLENALQELQKVRDIVAQPQHIQGNLRTKHGIVAEHIEIRFNNADNLMVGNVPSHIKEPNLSSSIDYYKSGQPIQSKFVQKNLSIDAINDHLNQNPDFLSKGGYDIPCDYFNKIQEWRNLSPRDLNNLSSSEDGEIARNVVRKIKEFEQVNNVKFEDVVHPAQVTYDEVQLGKVGITIDNKEQEISDVDEAERQKYELKARASFKEGLKVAGIAAAIDGVLSFGTTVISKFRQGKKLSDFTDDDWRDIFKETGIGIGRGGVTGGSIYALTNVGGMSAPLAAGIVTATFGIAKQAIQLANGNISTDDFIYNIQQLSVDTAVSGVGAVVGQALIPIPVVGAVVGSLVATIVLGTIRENLLGGSYYDLVSQAKYQNEMSSIYRLLTTSMERSRQTFEDMVQTYVLQTQQYQQLQQQDIKNNNKLHSLLESI
ncbi:hypothetical protein [Sporomusa aerivorans]|uniref:hypothetical protein n=1 Tax=Sporomusa aerivorans TaxID=204936 RepID=UPI00352B026E